MRKIIITFIATVFMIVPFEKAKAQRIISADFPTTNVTIGATAGISLSIWRIEVFMPPSIGLIQLGYGLQLFEERITLMDQGGMISEYHLPRLSGRMSLRLGYLGFKITGRDIIRAGLSIDVDGVLRGFYDIFLEYVHTRCLSQRISLGLSVGVGYSAPNMSGFGSTSVFDFESDMAVEFGFGHTAIELGIKLNYEILRNLYFGIRLGYTSRFVNEVRGLENPEMFSNNFTRNFLDFSVGLHYRFRILSPFETSCRQNVPRPQRVRQHHRALPCPPAQMRHNRSWDRPSSVFNHPTAR